MRLRLIALLGVLAMPAYAQTTASPQGLWWTEDRSGVIQIAPCAEGLCGRIVGQIEPRDAGGNVTLDIHGVPHCGLLILRGRLVKAGHWRGSIVNPEDGSVWNCEFWVGADGALRLRGYVLVELIGQTQIWPRFQGQVAKDCTIS
jgi:uncharacterized protein (DUF2147 family)